MLVVVFAALMAVSVPPRLYAQRLDRLEVKLRQGTNIAIALSPDRSQIAFDLQGTIWKMPVAGGKATPLTDELNDARQPAWSPDGKSIAFQSYRDGNWHISTVSADGSQLKQITTGHFDDREPHWSPDGKSIVFTSDRSGNYDIWQIDLSSNSLEQLTRDSANDYNPAWSPDGSQIAFVSERADGRGIWLIKDAASADKRQQVLFHQSNAPLAAPAWSQNGTHISFQSLDRGRGATALLVKPVAGEQQARAISADGEDVFPFRAAWLNDTELIYSADGSIKRSSLENNAKTALPFEATVTLHRPDYARKKRDFDSTASRPARGIVAPSVSPDGRRVAFTALGDLWIQEPGKKAERITDDIFVETHPAWSPDGSKLVYASDREGQMDLWVRDLKTGQSRALLKTSAGAAYPAWSPDGKRVAFFGGDSGSPLGGRLQVFEVETGETKEAMRRPVSPAQITWGPGGRSLAVTALNPYSSRYREGVFEVLIV
ncbi:MAG TPA: amidohydrolase, partial [Blastocatellia bacterium]|nr:amidohydrolase [Blastocatellia bacterium]